MQARPMSSGTRHHKTSAPSNSVPPLSLHNRLEIQSSPIHLATRSLSSRSSSNTRSSLPFSVRPSSAKTQEVSLPPKDTKRPSSSVRIVRHSKKTKQNVSVHPAKLLNSESNRKANHVDVQSQSNQVPKAAPVITSTQKGFNIADHLRDAGELDRSSGSLSPDVDQFLKNIGALVRPLTPDTDQEPQTTHSETPPGPNKHPPTQQEVRKESAPDSVGTTGAHISGKDSKGHSKKSHRPKVAANFGASSEQAVHNKTRADPEGDLPNHSPTEASLPNAVQPQETQSTSPPESKTVEVRPPTQVSVQESDQNVAAAKIQSWYRRVRSAHHGNVRSVLQEKRDELNRSKAQELVEAESKEMEKRQRRAAKMQAARRAAIEELNKKREEKRLRAEKIAQEEIVSGTNFE